MTIDGQRLREAGISLNQGYRDDSRSSSLREAKAGRNAETLIEVCTTPEPEPRRNLIEGIMPDGALTILFGDGGLGKSYLALYIATCVSLGMPIAGRPVEQGPVLYLDAELDQEEFRRRAYAIARGLGLEQPPKGLFYWRLPGSLTDPKVLRQALSHKNDCAAKLAIIDSLTVGAAGIDPKEARDIISLLKNLEAFGTTLALDHIRTPEPGSDTSGFRPFGSAFKHHLARSLLMISKSPAGALALKNTKTNFDALAAPIYLSLDVRKKERIVKIDWLEPTDPKLAGMTNIPTEDRVLHTLARSEGEVSTPQAIAKELGIEPKTVSNHLSALRAKGRADPLGDGRWRFLPDSPS